MEIKRNFDVIVVGAGMAGLSGAAYLCKNGYDILLLEKNSEVGGLVGSFERNGFHFDAGARALENSGVIFPMLKQLGMKMEFVKNEISIGLEDDFIILKDIESIDDYRKLLERHFPGNIEDISAIIKEIRKVVGYMEVIYGIDNPLFSDSMDDPDYLFRTILPWLVRYQINIKKAMRLNLPIKEYLGKYTKNQALIDFISQHFFAKTPTFFALSYFGLYLDYHYPIQGTGDLALKLRDYIVENGGTIVTDTRVDRINIDDKKIVTSTGEEYGFKKLVWAADNKALYDSIDSADPITNMAVEKHKIRTARAKGGDSVLSVFLSVDKDSEYFGSISSPHVFYTPTKAGISSIDAMPETGSATKDQILRWLHDYLCNTTYEISIPNLRNPWLAPENQTGLIVSTLMDYRLIEHIAATGWYEQFKEFAINEIVNVLERSLYPGLGERIVEQSCATPLSIANHCGSFEGAITGWSFENHPLPCVSDLKKIAKAVETEFPDILQCGQWTFSPSGVPVSIITGKLASDRIAKGLGAKKGDKDV